MFLSKRARVAYKLEWKRSLTDSQIFSKENVSWTIVHCSPSNKSEHLLGSLNDLYLVVASVVCLLLYRFPEDTVQEIQSEESQTVDGFFTDESPLVYEECFDRNKYIPLGRGVEKKPFFSHRISLENTEKGIWITALCSCVSTNEKFISLLIQSGWILVGWNNGYICLVDIPSGKILAKFYSEQVQSAVCCLAHQCKSSLFASGHMNGEIWLWNWQPYDRSLLSTMNDNYEAEYYPFLSDHHFKELDGCYYKKHPITRIDRGMEPRSWIRFATLQDKCILLSHTNNKLLFFTIREQLIPLVSTEETVHLSTATISIDNAYGQILDSILTDHCMISCGQDDTIRIFQSVDSFSTDSSLLSSCELYQHFSYVTCLEMSNNHKLLISASLDGTILFWLLEDCLPSRYVHPLTRIYLENVAIKSIQLVRHHLLVSGSTDQNTCAWYCLTLPAIVEKAIT
ncbi:hypothetical protein GpartN1_g1005.t1 [Galdieria partita]|uniref:Uncharacterized protein n=1 Tax=Galdieria partita TaxID=83374 RepID=A0A9C7PS37_9RHOD|nr:hypothetical protein GpartN1_g1005.t1 [Galdieria partita]